MKKMTLKLTDKPRQYFIPPGMNIDVHEAGAITNAPGNIAYAI
jgi:hypothetical protein